MSGSVEIRPPQRAEIQKVLAMLTRAYAAAREGFPDDPAVLRAYSDHDIDDDPARWVVLFDGAEPVSALRLFLREVTAPDGVARIGGIGNVGTDPLHGGRGLATRVLDAAHARLLAGGVETALLVTDIPSFYARVGYATVRQGELIATVDGGGAPAPAASFAFGADAPAAVVAAHAHLAARVGGRVARTTAYWSRWILAFKVEGSELDARYTEDAYVIGRREEGGAAYRALEGAGAPDALAALLESRLAGARRLKAPDDPAFRPALARLSREVSSRERTGIMARPLAPGALGARDLSGFLELDTF